MEAGAYFIMLGVSTLVLAVAYVRWREIAPHVRAALRAYVTQRPAAPSEPGGGLADTDAPEPASEPAVPAGREPVPAADAHRVARIRLLADLRELDGSYSYSANKIADLVGGQRADVLAVIRGVRGDERPPADPAKALRVRDAAGERLIAR